MLKSKTFSSIPIEFDKQDEGHNHHNPRMWKVMTQYYYRGDNYPYKRFPTGKVFTGPFIGSQTEPKKLLEQYFSKKPAGFGGYTVKNLK